MKKCQWIHANAQLARRPMRRFSILCLLAFHFPALVAQEKKEPSLRITVLRFSGVEAGDSKALFDVLYGNLKLEIRNLVSDSSAKIDSRHSFYIRNLELSPSLSTETSNDTLKSSSEDFALLIKSDSLLLLRGAILNNQSSDSCCISPSYAAGAALRSWMGSTIGPVPQQGTVSEVTELFHIMVLMALASDAKLIGKEPYIITGFASEARERLVRFQKDGVPNELKAWATKATEVISGIME